jgi:hypothetical protein
MDQLPVLRPHLRFFITSRPEFAIEDILDQNSVQRLDVELEESSNLADVEQFIDHSMDYGRFQHRKPPSKWPTPADRQQLADISRAFSYGPARRALSSRLGSTHKSN